MRCNIYCICACIFSTAIITLNINSKPSKAVILPESSAVPSSFYTLSPLRKLRCRLTQDISYGSNNQNRPTEIHAVFGLPTSDSFQKVLNITLPEGATVVSSAPHSHPCAVINKTITQEGSERFEFTFDVAVQGKKLIPKKCQKVTWEEIDALGSGSKEWITKENIVQVGHPTINNLIKDALGDDYRDKMTPIDAAYTLYEYMSVNIKDGVPKNLSQKCYRADNVFMSRLVVPISSERDALPTIWEVTDSMWENFFEPLILHLDPPFKMGRPRADQRKCLDGMIYRARTGCQWNQLPEKFGSDSTVHRTIQRWDSKGVFDAVWALLIYHCEELQAVNWEWQAVDGTLNKARFIGNGQKGGCKRASQMLGQPKSGRKTSREERRATRVKGSAPTQQIVRKWESREVFLSKETAIRFLS